MLLFIVGLLSACILNSCVPTLRTDRWTAPEKVDWLNDYKRDIELLLEYEGKEYKMRATIDCKYIKNGAIGIGGIEPDYAKIRNFVTIWETSITNNKLTLASGEELELKMLFFNGDKAEKFYRDDYVEKLKEKLDQCYDEKTGYYSKVLEGDRFTVILVSEHLSMNYYPELKKFIIGDNLKIKEYKISKRY